jgi:hypothetical protein
MRLYVNGDSHAAAAEAVNPHCFAEDDGNYFYLGRAPHPDNAKHSWARRLSDVLKCPLYLDAESASSNARIIRTTREWIAKQRPWLSETLMIIQWSTWEREEWFIDNRWYQVNASGIDHVPSDHVMRYKRWITDINWAKCRNKSHAMIWDFHEELLQSGIQHIFFNGNNDLSGIDIDRRKNWGTSYIGPYDPEMTYDFWLRQQGFQTVLPDSWHFGPDAHAAWSHFMLQYIVSNNLMV